MAAKLLTRFKQKIESLELRPAGGGCFELTIDGELVYSKLQSGQFPNEEKIVAEAEQRF